MSNYSKVKEDVRNGCLGPFVVMACMLTIIVLAGCAISTRTSWTLTPKNDSINKANGYKSTFTSITNKKN